MTTRKQKEDFVRRVHKRLCDTKTPSFATIAHNCGFTIAEVNLLKKHGFVVRTLDGWMWNGECNPKKVVDTILLKQRGETFGKQPVQRQITSLCIAGITVHVRINDVEHMEVGHVH